MKINIVSKDLRYVKVNELLLQKGYDSFISPLEDYCGCDCLILSIVNELSHQELKALLAKTKKSTLVLCGNESRIRSFFDGCVIDYSKNEDFLQKNACLTAEAAVSYIHSVTKESVNGKKAIVIGYGRIGKPLCRILKSLGASVSAYARREEVRAKILHDGYKASSIERLPEFDIIINTVPSSIVPKHIIEQMPKGVHLIELASPPYGFENMEGVHIGSSLPGKILPYSAAEVIFDAIESKLSLAEKGNT